MSDNILYIILFVILVILFLNSKTPKFEKFQNVETVTKKYYKFVLSDDDYKKYELMTFSQLNFDLQQKILNKIINNEIILNNEKFQNINDLINFVNDTTQKISSSEIPILNNENNFNLKTTVDNSITTENTMITTNPIQSNENNYYSAENTIQSTTNNYYSGENTNNYYSAQNPTNYYSAENPTNYYSAENTIQPTPTNYYSALNPMQPTPTNYYSAENPVQSSENIIASSSAPQIVNYYKNILDIDNLKSSIDSGSRYIPINDLIFAVRANRMLDENILSYKPKLLFDENDVVNYSVMNLSRISELPKAKLTSYNNILLISVPNDNFNIDNKNIFESAVVKDNQISFKNIKLNQIDDLPIALIKLTDGPSNIKIEKEEVIV
jgi:hypothetical protein